MRDIDIVIDTNVIVTALRSRHGAAQKLLRLIGQGHFRLNIRSRWHWNTKRSANANTYYLPGVRKI
jgi:predicted nucleic acid-binding protein